MFEFISKHKRWIMIVFLILIVPPFAFFGLESYTRPMADRDQLASIDGAPVFRRDFENEMRQQQDRLRAALGGAYDMAAFDTPEARTGVLESMITQRLIAGEAQRAHLVVSDETLRDSIAGMQAFQANGQFSRPAYEALLRAQGMTPASFESRLRYDLSVSQLARSIAETAILPRTVAARVSGLEEQRREVAEHVIGYQAFLSLVKVDEAQARAHYDANLAQYRAAERVRAEYVVLSAEELGRREPATDAELKALYDSRSTRYKVDEQRRASHILILAGPDAKDAERQAARRKAGEILSELRKSPARFADLARTNSQDPGSAESGGDLGFFSHGMMVKPFEDAAFKLKEGELSDIVETEFGYHIIRITGIQPAKIRPLDEVRDELAAEIGKQKASKRFAEAAEAFTNTVFEQPDSLKPAAEQYRLELRTSDWITRTPTPDMGVLAHPKMLSALFSADSLRDKRNTDAVEFAPGALVAARVVAHEPAKQRPFDEVKAQIEQELRRRDASKLARADGAAKLAALKPGGADAAVKWNPPRSVSRRDSQGIPPDTLRQVLAADPAGLPAFFGANRGEYDFVLYRVSRALEPAARDDAAKKAAIARIEQQAGAEQFSAYVTALRGKAKIEINKTALNKPAGG